MYLSFYIVFHLSCTCLASVLNVLHSSCIFRVMILYLSCVYPCLVTVSVLNIIRLSCFSLARVSPIYLVFVLRLVSMFYLSYIYLAIYHLPLHVSLVRLPSLRVSRNLRPYFSNMACRTRVTKHRPFLNTAFYRFLRPSLHKSQRSPRATFSASSLGCSYIFLNPRSPSRAQFSCQKDCTDPCCVTDKEGLLSEN